jgi:predicted RNA-binding Zn ribbon-like protein
MTGEVDPSQHLDSVQPGGRAPAPGDLALVQAFLNSHYDLQTDHGAELFATPEALARWLSARGLIEPGARVGVRELDRALAIRAGLRALISGRPTGEVDWDGVAIEELNRAAAGAATEVRFGPSGPRFVAPAAAGVPGALALVLARTAEAMIDGRWTRLKLCPGEDCGWAFYDHSRNRTGRWCSMSVCGGRAKARTHYHRGRGAR